MFAQSVKSVKSYRGCNARAFLVFLCSSFFRIQVADFDPEWITAHHSAINNPVFEDGGK